MTVSDSVLALVVEHLDADALASLASLRRAQDVARRPRLSSPAVEDLARMVTAGGTPTIGWWRRNGGAS